MLVIENLRVQGSDFPVSRSQSSCNFVMLWDGIKENTDVMKSSSCFNLLEREEKVC